MTKKPLSLALVTAIALATGLVVTIGVGLRQLNADGAPTVSLVEPPDGSVSSSTTVTFACDATDDVGLQEAALYTGRLVEVQKQFRQDGSVAGTTDDAQITADTPTTNDGAGTILNIDGQTPHAHAVFKYPNLFGNDPGQVPLGVEIVSATLTVNCFNPGNLMTAYRLLEDWVETETTWNNRSAGVSWGNPGADGAASHDSAGVTWNCTTSGVKTFDLTAIMQAWSAGAPNYGVVALDSGVDGNDFYSSEDPALANRPMLTVRYRVLESWGPQQIQPLNGTAARATFTAAIQDQSTYQWNCQVTDASGQSSFAPADFQLYVNTAWTPPTSTTPNFKVAFLGDQGLTAGSRAVLQLIKDEGAQMVLHQGDFDYTDNPTAWDDQITSVLGANFPYFAVIGNHDVTQWAGYQQKLAERLARIPGASCTGDLGVQATCRYQGLYFLTVAPGITGTGHEAYLRDQLAADNSVWSICSWHKVQQLMQVGGKTDETGWGVYEECRLGGGILATAHEHSYSRTHLLSDFQTQTVATTSPTFVIEPGKSFAFVSGMGGHSIRPQLLSGAWWASIYTSTQDADFGALFCTFNADGRPDVAICYFKDIRGRITDSFELRSNVEDIGNRTPIALAGPDQTVSDADSDGYAAVTLDAGASYDLDGQIAAVEWREGTTVLSTSATWTGTFAVGTHPLTLTVNDNQGISDTDSVVITVTPYTPPTTAKTFRQGVGTAGTTDDAQLTADTPTKKSGGATSLKVDGLSPHSHVVLKIPDLFGGGAEQVPPGAQIISATLQLNCFNAGNPMTAYRLNEDWVEPQTNWKYRKNKIIWSNPGADGATSRDSAGIIWDCTTTGVKTLDLTGIVQAWAAGASNYGVVVIETGQDDVEFYSSEHATLANRPLLTVTYK